MRNADDKLPVPGLVENIAQRSTRNSMVYPDLQGLVCMEFRCGVHNSIQTNPCKYGYAMELRAEPWRAYECIMIDMSSTSGFLGEVIMQYRR